MIFALDATPYVIHPKVGRIGRPSPADHLYNRKRLSQHVVSEVNSTSRDRSRRHPPPRLTAYSPTVILPTTYTDRGTDEDK